MSQMIDIDKIGYDPKFYPRVNGQPDWMTILRYTEALQTDSDLEFPAVVLVRSVGHDTPYLLIDGLHRTRSYLKAGRVAIPANIERLPESKWLSRSVELNVSHGRQLDTGDKAWIATRLQEEGWELPAISQLLRMRVESLERIVSTRCVRLSHKAAELLKVGRSNREGQNGSYGFLKAPLVSALGRRSQVAALETQHSVTSHDVLAVLDSTLSVLKAGCVNMADEDIASRVQAIKELLDLL